MCLCTQGFHWYILILLTQCRFLLPLASAGRLQPDDSRLGSHSALTMVEIGDPKLHGLIQGKPAHPGLSPSNIVFFWIKSPENIQNQIWDWCLEASWESSEEPGRTAGGRGFTTGMGSTWVWGWQWRMDMDLRLAPLRQGLKQAGRESLESLEISCCYLHLGVLL